MIKLLIVDNGKRLRERIKKTLSENTQEVVVCGMASNALEALQLAEQVQPDIVLTDIRMPGINGLEMIDTLSEKYPETKFIILSSYKDFEHARQAVSLGVSEYLLKPCSDSEILSAITKVRQGIEADGNRRGMYDRMRVQFRESSPLLKEKFLSGLLNVEMKNRDALINKAALYEIPLVGKYFIVAAIRIDRYYSLADENSYEEIELNKFSIRSIAGDILKGQHACELFDYSDDVIVILNTAEELPSRTTLKVFHEVKSRIRELMGFSVSIGVGCCHKGLDSIVRSYREAEKALEEAFFVGENSITVFDSGNGGSGSGAYPIQEEKAVLACIREGNSKDLQVRLGEFSIALNHNAKSRHLAVKAYQHLLFSAYNLCLEKRIPTEELFGRDLSSLDELPRLKTFHSLQNRVLEILEAAMGKMEGGGIGNRMIEKVIGYIQEHYQEDLSLESVAREIYITPRYLCTLFKQTTGVNFLDYYHEVRIQKACRLLEKNPMVKIYQVAFEVGYGNERYFTHVFKKYVGKTPKQYKENFK